jgi:electron-transferring-flavoprotein dehydrogenase
MLRISRNAARTSIRFLHSSRVIRADELFDPCKVERASDNVDVCIVGAGPAGLSAAIRLKQLEKEKGKDIRVVVLEKGSEVGELSPNYFMRITL